MFLLGIFLCFCFPRVDFLPQPVSFLLFFVGPLIVRWKLMATAAQKKKTTARRTPAIPISRMLSHSMKGCNQAGGMQKTRDRSPGLFGSSFSRLTQCCNRYFWNLEAIVVNCMFMCIYAYIMFFLAPNLSTWAIFLEVGKICLMESCGGG